MSSDFLKRLKGSKDQYNDARNAGGTKRRKFVPGLELTGRLLPYLHSATGDLRFIDTHYMHYFATQEGGKWNLLTCPKQGDSIKPDWDASCPFCDFARSRYESTGDGSDKLYANYKRKKKFKVNFYLTSVNVIAGYTVPDEDKDVWTAAMNSIIVLDIPLTLREKIDTALNDPDLGEAIFSPEDGFDFRIKITKKANQRGSDDKMVDYSLSDFARKMSTICGDKGPDEFIAGCDDIVASLQALTAADSSRIKKAAETEGIIPSEAPGQKKTKAAVVQESDEDDEGSSDQPVNSVSELMKLYSGQA